MADLPMEPTPEMLKAGAMRIAMNQQYVGTAEAKARMVWRDMVAAHTPADWTDDAMCLSGLADRLEEESATESDRGNDSTAAAWSCRAYELRQIVSKMVRSNAGVSVLDPLSDTQAELDAVTREMDVIYERWPKKEDRAKRDELLTPLRARCVDIGQRRYRIADGVRACDPTKEDELRQALQAANANAAEWERRALADGVAVVRHESKHPSDASGESSA